MFDGSPDPARRGAVVGGGQLLDLVDGVLVEADRYELAEVGPPAAGRTLGLVVGRVGVEVVFGLFADERGVGSLNA